ncbi:2,3-diaminopropionate biosynthesis protein SbnB [Micromonospora sediminicola]|uniref:2,3-diaminopropionate biosynthesis protein SbnB n=1 Tax=Micromonospora sediminicola TaxID=946078 RepID=UPI0033A3A909
MPGAAVHQALRGEERELIDLVEQAYLLHGAGSTVNPPSYFLRFPDRPDARIIALPASVSDTVGVDGIKWISSFPANLAAGLPRASAVLILNDPRTGFPYACLEGSIISAARTAASAAVAMRAMTGQRGVAPRRVGFVGTGLIARYIDRYLLALGWELDEIGVFDLVAGSSSGFAVHLRGAHPDARIVGYGSAEELLENSDVAIFATTAAAPHVGAGRWLEHNPLVLHVSLRDLAVEVIDAVVNVVDDRDHVLQANTSLHLAQQAHGGADPAAATLYDLLTDRFTIPVDRPVVFSPFGLGVLDLVVGDHVFRAARECGEALVVDRFFFDMQRHSAPDSSGLPTVS